MSLLRRTWRVLLWRFQRVQAVQLTTVVYFAFACRQLARILSSGSLPRSICWQTSVTDCPVSNTHLLKKNAIFAFQFEVEGSRIIRLSSAWIRVCHFFLFPEIWDKGNFTAEWRQRQCFGDQKKKIVFAIDRMLNAKKLQNTAWNIEFKILNNYLFSFSRSNIRFSLGLR